MGKSLFPVELDGVVVCVGDEGCDFHFLEKV
jgi:hypothetical protein